MSRWSDEQIAKLGPAPTTLSERLSHTVRAFEDERDDDDWVVRATQNAYAPGVTTGLTWGDIRALALLVNDFAPRTREVPTALARLRAMHGED